VESQSRIICNYCGKGCSCGNCHVNDRDNVENRTAVSAASARLTTGEVPTWFSAALSDTDPVCAHAHHYDYGIDDGEKRRRPREVLCIQGPIARVLLL